MIQVVKEELLEAKENYADDRRTVLEENEFEHDIEDLIQREDMVITVSLKGYIKRVPLSTYKAQHRGGKGRSGMSTRDEDVVDRLFVANTHTPVLFFTSRGMVYQMKVYRLPLGTPQARGKAMVNLLPLEEGEWIQTVMPMPVDEDTWDDLQVMFATSAGTVRRNALSDFTNIKRNGKIAMKLEEGERLISVQPCSEKNDVLLTTRDGKAIRFGVSDVRVFRSRGSMGVRVIKLINGDAVVGMSILVRVEHETPEAAEISEREIYLKQTSYLRRSTVTDQEGEVEKPDIMLSDERLAYLGGAEEFVLTVTEKGIGKRTSAYEYRTSNRGGQGVWNIDVTERSGQVVAGFPVNNSDQIMLVTDSGQLIRCLVDEIGITGRRTQGVWIFRVEDGEKVVSVSLIGDDMNGESETPSSNEQTD